MVMPMTGISTTHGRCMPACTISSNSSLNLFYKLANLEISMELSKLTRRSFNKVAAFSSAVLSLGALSSGLKEAKAAPVQIKNAEQDETKIIKTNCRACIFNCGVLAHVRNGRVVKLEGNPEYPMTKGSMCAKGLSGLNAFVSSEPQQVSDDSSRRKRRKQVEENFLG